MEEKTFRLNMMPEKHPLGWKSYSLATTQSSTITGVSGLTATAYGLQPILFIRQAVDAARARMRYLQITRQEVLPTGHSMMFIPKRSKYLADTSWETSAAEYTTSDITATTIDTMAHVEFTPTNYNYALWLTNDAIRKNAFPLIQYCQEELSYKYENSIDNAVRNAISGTVVADAAGTGTEPTGMSNTVLGAQTVFGGDATSADNSLDTGDVLTPELLLKAKRLLMSSVGYYWNASHVWTKSAITTNPWPEEEGYVAFVAPEQWESLIQDSTFLSAAEYGGREAVLQGEIRNFAGIRIVVTDKVPAFEDGKSYQVTVNNTSTETDADVAGHICTLIKPRKAVGLVWGRKAEFKTWDHPERDQVRMKLSMAYQAKAIYPDAIVRMIVADE